MEVERILLQFIDDKDGAIPSIGHPYGFPSSRGSESQSQTAGLCSPKQLRSSHSLKNRSDSISEIVVAGWTDQVDCPVTAKYLVSVGSSLKKRGMNSLLSWYITISVNL